MTCSVTAAVTLRVQCGFREESGGPSGRKEAGAGLVPQPRPDGGARTSGTARGLDSKDALEVELAAFDQGDKTSVLTLEIQRWLRSVCIIY